MKFTLPTSSCVLKAARVRLSSCSWFPTHELRTQCAKLSTLPLSTRQPLDYHCNVEAEPLHRYCPGGYHPVHLGDVFKDGRYTILHKLGSGGFSTVWIARDRLMSRYVALKIAVSKTSPEQRESRILQTLSQNNDSSHPGHKHIMRFIDDFSHDGPNGTHACLIFERLGPSIATVTERKLSDDRLPGFLARRVCKEVLLAVDFLHQQNIGHGDLHVGNIAFTSPPLESMSEKIVLDRLGSPQTGLVRASDGQPLTPGMPRYLVCPAKIPIDESDLNAPIKLIDFGESFLPDDRPQTSHTPLALRAPEALLGNEWDSRTDLWTLGCTMFELIVGQTPFTGIMAKKGDVIQQMIDTIGELPAKWQSNFDAMPKLGQFNSFHTSIQSFVASYSKGGSLQPDDEIKYNLEQLLQELYFDPDKVAEFTQQDITQLAKLIGKLLR